MQIAAGALLVLASWAVIGLLLALLGLLPALLTQQGPPRAMTLVRSVWWGLLLVTLLAIGINQWLPLRSAAAGVIVLAAIALMGVTGVLLTRRRQRFAGSAGCISWSLVAAVVVVAATFAASAVGPLTNTDSGLYHLGAIRYAGEFSAIPGLSNLYGPLGYGTATFPLAALLGNGPWGIEGTRLLNGLLITLVGVDLLVRMSRRRRSAGFYVALVGFTVLAVPMMAIADFWVTSPTQDAGAFALTIVATAYLADALTQRRAFTADAGVTCAIAVLIVLIRPTMGAFALVALGTLILRWRGIRSELPPAPVYAVTALVLGSGLASVALSMLRDRTLSGWWLYPLSILPFDVPWRAGDPTELREATLGYHRNPDDLWGSIEGWGWVGSWIGRLPGYWEAWLLALLAITAIVMLLLAGWRRELRWRPMVACLGPSAVATAVWFVASPPSFRFAWGPVFTLAVIPLGWALWRLRLCAAQYVAAGVISAVALISLVGRTEWSSMTQERIWQLGVAIPYAVTPLPEVPTNAVEVATDFEVLVPAEGEQCWGVFPLCTPSVDPHLERVAGSLAERFVP